MFIFTSAVQAGFRVRSSRGALQVTSPRRVPPAARAPFLQALFDHGDDIVQLLQWLEQEAARGVFWALPERGPAQ